MMKKIFLILVLYYGHSPIESKRADSNSTDNQLGEVKEKDERYEVHDKMGSNRLTDSICQDMINGLFPPWTPEQIDTKFFLYTRRNRENRQIITKDDESLANSYFDSHWKTIFIIHGWTDNPLREWQKNMTERLLLYSDFNVIRVDWSKGAAAEYQTAASNTRVVGKEVGGMINYLASRALLNVNETRVIGHSLGAHVAGFTGLNVEDILGQITGLDPAGPLFRCENNYERLSYLDANFVDCIHTNQGPVYPQEGNSAKTCHQDVYPNNGAHQPGCNNTQSNASSCSHHRAHQLFTDSILSQCQFIAHECVTYDSYMNGNCSDCKEDGSNCVKMGFHSQKQNNNRSRVSYYLTTGANAPYCLYHYSITVKIHRKSSDVYGELWLNATGANLRRADNILLVYSNDKTSRRLNARRQYTYMFRSPVDLGSIVRIDLLWIKKNWLSGSIITDKLLIENIEIEPIDVITSVRENLKRTLESLTDSGGQKQREIRTFLAIPIQ